MDLRLGDESGRRAAAMDLQLGDESGRRATGRGGKMRQQRLGLKRPSMAAAAPTSTAPTPGTGSPTPSPASVPPPPLDASPAAMTTTAAAPTISFAFPTASPGGTLPPPPPGLGGAPNFAAFHGNLEGPNSWLYLRGGFGNLMNGQNFHFVGQSMAFNPISPTAPTAHVTGSTEGGNHFATNNRTVTIDVDKDENSEENMSAKKKFWTHEEEERLASDWLNASKDPIRGNDKKFDTFWKEVTAEFNSKENGKKKREINQLKIHWSRLKSSISKFNEYWNKVCQMNTSGYSDDMLEKQAQRMYANKFGKTFTLVHWWKILKNEHKWCAQFQDTAKDNSEVVQIPGEQLRPIGRDAAKAERGGKRKKDNALDGIVILGDNIDKIIKVQEDWKIEHEKVTEAQIDISETNLKAAKEDIDIRDQSAHRRLKKDLVEHIWTKFGGRRHTTRV